MPRSPRVEDAVSLPVEAVDVGSIDGAALSVGPSVGFAVGA